MYGKNLISELREKEIFKRLHHVEFYVSSAKTWSYFMNRGLGFKTVAYAGPETGIRDKISYVMSQGTARISFTSSMNDDSYISNHVKKHGDGVKDIALEVDDLDEAKSLIEKYGTRVSKINEIKDGNGKIRTAEIKTYGETVHTLIETGDYNGVFMPGYEESEINSKNTGIKKIDHIVGNVYEGEMDSWVNFYIEKLGFEHLITFDDKDIRTDYSALRSKVVKYNDDIVFPINEPAKGLRKSQIEEYLDYYRSEGVQHIALLTDDIIKTVSMMEENGIEFLKTPGSYYESLLSRIGSIDEDLNEIEKHNILVDRDENGYLLQIFTKPVTDRPTFFFEVIQRKGARSFGNGNFKALFEAIEREQAKRGNL
ncbi:4-hydroxyphenylpyruvate dioxygenase [Picrophilus oshimae]|uniref:4-hydroxyphenylpyruvate dioxygenase n=1 Tax=Picrophilus torridus (strain ATCC 700027 / DSM 9790 / JCM 10055 / NBRC 100828 / KAW 2/3) TaxID=1122961 RepID=A0A8G2L7D5_PICTO|nr:4-hydroxyphenylpyruvate dioxygenase [Picrophilus oshimae]SMD30973.1 4-hydroxyphenylpyruvate dioxygenase [Picrophilus oshimae DSM 9789]